MMDSVNRTLYIPLHGKSFVSKKGIILHDAKAEEIWAAEGFALRGKSASKWLAYYMGMRSAVFDRWLKANMEIMPEVTVLHLGCGMDSRICRVGNGEHLWYDVDFPEVIEVRKRYYQETDHYNMVAADVCAQQESCTALLKGIFLEGKMHFLIGERSGMLVWKWTEEGAGIVAIHSLPESWGTGLGHAMLEKALERIGDCPVQLWAFKENSRARRFYEKHGFHWDGIERVSEFDGSLEVHYVRG